MAAKAITLIEKIRVHTSHSVGIHIVWSGRGGWLENICLLNDRFDVLSAISFDVNCTAEERNANGAITLIRGRWSILYFGRNEMIIMRRGCHWTRMKFRVLGCDKYIKLNAFSRISLKCHKSISQLNYLLEFFQTYFNISRNRIFLFRNIIKSICCDRL